MFEASDIGISLSELFNKFSQRNLTEKHVKLNTEGSVNERDLSKFNKSRSQYSLNYDPELIHELKQSHQDLLSTYGAVFKDGFLDVNMVLLVELLAQFKSEYKAHLYKENMRLYGFLEYSMKPDANSSKKIHEFRKEMMKTTKCVIDFCDKYNKVESVYMNFDTFKQLYHETGHALVHRIQSQERELYSLYERSSGAN